MDIKEMLHFVSLYQGFLSPNSLETEIIEIDSWRSEIMVDGHKTARNGEYQT